MTLADNKISWTDDRINLLKRMWKEGKSAADIAKSLGKGVTRNAVIGKAHRMGLSGRPSPIKAPEPKKAAAPPKKAVKPAPPPPPPKKAAKPAPAPAKPNPVLAREVEEMKKVEKEAVPEGGGVPLIDLTERMCKWPIGDPKEADFTFCGRGIRQGTPYCPAHAAAAYQTSSRRGPIPTIVAPVAKEVDEVEEVVEEDEAEAV
jgi:GcrA cell cycle regulator